MEFFRRENIFVVDVKCGLNFTVCQSLDGKLYTFGDAQALSGKEVKDDFGNTINYCNCEDIKLKLNKVH